jgi:hypothetical protein
MKVTGNRGGVRLGVITGLAVFAGLSVGPVLAAAASPPTELYVTAGGSAGGPCSASSPCNSVSRAVVVANHQPFTFAPVVINVGKGRFVTHLNFPDMSYPEPMLTISGVSATTTVLSAGGAGPVLSGFADAPKIALQDLTISDQSAPLHDGGNFMNFTGVTFSHNSPGGALFDDGGSVQVAGSTFTGNSLRATSGGGGAISQTGGTLVVTGSVFTGNTVNTTSTTAVGSGGAIYVSLGHLSIFGSTITANTATGTAGGGAIGVDQTTSVTVIGSTINANKASGPGGLVRVAGTGRIGFGGDILVGNTGANGSVCSGGGYHDLGYNLVDQSTCGVGAGSKVVTATAVGLLPLAPNGGPTKTEWVRKSSAAHDVAPVTAQMAGTAFCARQDQRGVPRRQGPATKCDVGAYQFAPPVVHSISPQKGAPGTGVVIRGFGFVFLALHFGAAAPVFTVSNDASISVVVPHLAAGKATIKLSNPDGQASTTFGVVAPKTTG